MALKKRHSDAGWHEVNSGPRRFAAEKYFSLPGASSTVLRVDADSRDLLDQAIDLREAQLSNEVDNIVVYPDGTTVSADEHVAQQFLGRAPVVLESPSSEELEANLIAAEATVDVADTGPKPEGALSDEERAKLRADEEELEAGIVEFEATEAAEELAKEEGIDLSEVEGSGKDGRILKSDVEDAVPDKTE